MPLPPFEHFGEMREIAAPSQVMGAHAFREGAAQRSARLSRDKDRTLTLKEPILAVSTSWINKHVPRVRRLGGKIRTDPCLGV
jgi:hypothetical protein